MTSLTTTSDDRDVWVCDSTLRDGSHAKSHAITVDEVRNVTRALDDAGVPFIEVAHGDGLGGSSINYGFGETDEFILMAAAVDVMREARLAVLLLPGIGVKTDLARALDTGAALVRVATHCTEADIAEQHLKLAREIGLISVGFLMMAHMSEPDALAAQARIMADAGAEVVYVTDSAGAMLPNEVADRVTALRAHLPEGVAVGFHGHHNLALGVANSLAAIEAGATWVDCSTRGLGAGAGNTPTEIFVAVCDKAGIVTGIDVMKIIDAAQDVVDPIITRRPMVDRSSLLLGYAGIYSSFLIHAERASGRFGVPTRDILLEVAERKAVGGQEDLIVEIASQLAGRNGP